MLAIVCGSRSHKVTPEGLDKLREVLIANKALIVFEGGCSGVDRSVKNYVESKRFLTITFNAEWEKYGKSAGPRRNKKMVLYAKNDPDAICVSFAGGIGTMNCRELAREAGLKMIDLSNEKYVVEICLHLFRPSHEILHP